VLRIGGLTPLSWSDYPGKLAAVVYCQGCAWRCSYCHNQHLMPRKEAGRIAWSDVTDLLKRRRGLLDAVVFSGGEPTLQSGLAAAVAEVKALGFLVGLHTAGIVPKHLQRLLPMLDWVAMDLKAPFETHHEVTGVAGSGRRAKESMELILASGVACRFHTVHGNAQVVHASRA